MPHVRKRGIILFLVLLVALAGWGISFALTPREPVYDGKPLSYWLKGYDPLEGSEPGRQQADQAVRQIGTNAIPLLLRMLREQDSPLKLKLIALARKQHVIKINYVSASSHNIQAAAAFEKLGPEAASAVPELVKICEMDFDLPPRELSFSREYIVIETLGFIGPRAKTAVPLILKSLEHNPEGIDAIMALGRIHAQPDASVPALAQCLKASRRMEIRCVGAWSLGLFGRDARPAVPLLVEMLKDPDRALEKVASEAIQQIDPETAAKLPVPSTEIMN